MFDQVRALAPMGGTHDAGGARSSPADSEDSSSLLISSWYIFRTIQK